MSEFKKYIEIENSYRQKYINEHLEYHSQCKEAKYIYQVKLDGSNISFWFWPDGTFRIAKRSGFISEDENFQGINSVLPKYQEIIEFDKQKAKEINNVFVCYGELFGKGVQNRIYYGPDKYITFFDVRVGEKMLVYEEMRDLIGIDHPLFYDYFIDTFGTYSFDEIFDIPVPEGHEGIVIKPYNRIDNERPLILKKKSPEFEEKMKTKKKKEIKPEDPHITQLKGNFLEYINKNRVLSVFSKEGEIKSPDQIGKYIQLVMEDVIKDFEKDIDILDFERKDLKQVYKSGNKEVVSILKEYL
jgi:hypothetical protein